MRQDDASSELVAILDAMARDMFPAELARSGMQQGRLLYNLGMENQPPVI